MLYIPLRSMLLTPSKPDYPYFSDGQVIILRVGIIINMRETTSQPPENKEKKELI